MCFIRQILVRVVAFYDDQINGIWRANTGDVILYKKTKMCTFLGKKQHL